MKFLCFDIFTELAEPVEIAKLLSSMYDGVIDSDVPKPEDAAKRKEDRKKLGEGAGHGRLV